MPGFELELPDDLVMSIKLPREEMPARLKRELALRLYEKGLLSFGKARELAGMTKWEFSKLLGEEDILRHYDVLGCNCKNHKTLPSLFLSSSHHTLKVGYQVRVSVQSQTYHARHVLSELHLRQLYKMCPSQTAFHSPYNYLLP